MKKSLILFTLSILFFGCQKPKEKVEEPFVTLTKLMDQYAENTIDNDNISSIALAIYKDGKVYSNYYANKETISIPDDNTLFEIASITKVFTGSLISKAVVEGKITLEDNVQDYLGEDYSNLQFEGNPITIKHLLSHTLGLKNKSPKGFEEVSNKVSEGFYENRPFEYDMSDLLEELKKAELDKKPGTVYAYTSVGPELLAYILEQVYKKSFKDLLGDFLTELDMKNTHLLDFEKHRKQISIGYGVDGKLAPLSKNPLLGGAAGMLSTLPDMVKFMTFQLESDNPLIKEATRELFKDDDDDTMGYLWDTGTAEEEGFYYSKTGTSSGTQSSLVICPDSNYGLIAIVNSTSEAAFQDWANLFYGKMENDLVKFPKLNLGSIIKPEFLKDKEAGKVAFNKLKTEKDKYFRTNIADALNRIGYDLMVSEKNLAKSIDIIKFAIEQEPENANLYDSLGEAYFTAKDYKNALLNYKKSLELNPESSNAKEYILEINKLIKE